MENPIQDVFQEAKEDRERLEKMRKERESDPNYGGNNYHQEIKSVDGAAGVVTLISLAVGILGLLIFIKIEPKIAIACFGQMFFTIGLATIFSQKLTLDNLPILLFPVAGAGCMFFPLDSLYRTKKGLPPLLDTRGIGILAGAGFMVIGLCLIIVPFIKRAVMLKKCTLTVQATCIGLDSRLSSSGSGSRHRRVRVFAPDWEYIVNGKIYNHQETTYSNVGYPEVGSVHEIFVDPNEPIVIYRKNSSRLVILIVGVIFVAVSLLTLYMMIFAM